jgi:putative transposase
MPGKNIIKQYAPKSYYHIYTRGVNKMPTFWADNDYTVFASLFKRYLSSEQPKNSSRHPYPNYRGRLQLLAYALMPNHIHLFVYQEDEFAIRDFMRSLLTSYSMYFNKTNKRVGPVFQSRYRASRIADDSYFQHISRYIHLNPLQWEDSDKTSLDFYLGKRRADWIEPEKVLQGFKDSGEYLAFLRDYEDQKQMFDELKWELANPDS